MRRNLYITLTAVISVIGLQVNYLVNSYLHYRRERIMQIQDVLVLTFDEELTSRHQSPSRDSAHIISVFPMDKMTNHEKDSLLKAKPLPVRQKSLDLKKARKLGIADTEYQLIRQFMQDYKWENGTPLNLNAFDSIFTSKLGESVPRHFTLYIKGKAKREINTLASKSPDVSWTYPIGTEGKQKLNVAINVPISGFFYLQWWNVSLSGLCMMCGLGVLIYQLTVIRRRNSELALKEKGINGTIHDLKAPLNSVVALLSYLKGHESVKSRRQLIEEGEINVRHMVSVIEELLQWGRRDRRNLIFHKERVDMNSMAVRVVSEVNVLLKFPTRLFLAV